MAFCRDRYAKREKRVKNNDALWKEIASAKEASELPMLMIKSGLQLDASRSTALVLTPGEVNLGVLSSPYQVVDVTAVNTGDFEVTLKPLESREKDIPIHAMNLLEGISPVPPRSSLALNLLLNAAILPVGGHTVTYSVAYLSRSGSGQCHVKVRFHVPLQRRFSFDVYPRSLRLPEPPAADVKIECSNFSAVQGEVIVDFQGFVSNPEREILLIDARQSHILAIPLQHLEPAGEPWIPRIVFRSGGTGAIIVVPVFRRN